MPSGTGILKKTLISFRGRTTEDGDAGGADLRCSDLTTKPDFNGNQVVILNGSYRGQARYINGSTTGGTVTVDSTFGGQILSGITFALVPIRTVPADVAAIEAKLDHGDYGLAALQALLDALEVKLDDGTTGLAALKALIDAIEAKLDTEPLAKKSGATTIAGGTDFTTLQTIIEDTNTGVRHIGDIFIDLNINGDASAFHNRATLGDTLTYQIEVSFDGTNYEYVDEGTVVAAANKIGIVIKDFWPVSKWRIRMNVDVDRGEYKFAWMYGGQA